MTDEKAFDEAYAKLNPAQKEAVDAVYGPVMVIAGPGTGKTQILALRIANILRLVPDAKPDEIVALTYTESAVASMRTRLAGLIGAAAYRVRIHTFHGFARLILDMRPEIFPRITTGTQLSEVSAIALMEELLDSGSYKRIRSPKDPYRLAKKLVSFISILKREHYTPESYKQKLTEQLAVILEDPDRINEKGTYAGKEKVTFRTKRERIEKHLEVADFFNAYEQALIEKNFYDYEDLIAESIRGLEEDEGFRADVGEKMQFVLADEHQDANPAQNRLLELVTDFDGAPNLFVVGDEKQAIYRFQGASLGAFFHFREKYPDAKIILLSENYRSTNEVLEAAHDLISPAPIPYPELRAKIASVEGKGPRLKIAAADTPQDEMGIIATYIQRLHADGVPHADIAVLTRTNSDVLALAEYLRGVGIPEDHASAELDALAHPAVRLFIDLIRAAAHPGNTAALGRALFIPGFPARLEVRMRALSLPREGKPLSEVLRTSDADIASWMRTISHAAIELRTTPALSFIARLASESGFLAGILSQAESEDAYGAYEAFMEEVRVVGTEKPSATALDVLEHIDRIEAHELSIKRARTKRDGVAVMTAHHAKGMEFPHVVIAIASDERWLGKRTNELSLAIESEDDDEHDIRRLLYVALTRAKKEVLITYAKENEGARAQTPLRFIADIASHLDEETFKEKPPKRVFHTHHPVLDTDFLKERFLARGFSPTGFNNYIASPWLYLLQNLLQIPDAPNRSMQFGTAIHAGLKAYTDALSHGSATPEDAITAFTVELARLPLAEQDRVGLTDMGEEALRAYLAVEAQNMTEVKEAEYNVSVPLDIPDIGTIALTGKLDRLDASDNEHATVIDYKTGAVKSENELRGLTKDADGNYYRQLIFYKLLLEKEGKYDMDKGSIHFIQPNDSGKIIIRDFVISEEEVRALEAELTTATKAIVSGEAFKTLPNPDDIPVFKDVLRALST